jgi:hypothetical protein
MLFSHDWRDVLNQLSPNEKQDLTELFKIFINEDQFGYTLFGDKPVSISGNLKIIPYELLLSGSKEARYFWKKWAVWKQYENQFSMSNYLLIEEPALHLDKNMTFIFLINKNAFLKTVRCHLKIFQGILGSDLTADLLLERITKENKFLSFINYNERLLGILLGYGAHNAKLFEKRKKMLSIRSLLDKEENLLSNQLQPFSVYGPWAIEPVQFAADPGHKETQLLKKKYAKLSKELSSHFSEKRDFLEIVLAPLTSK